MNIIQLPTNPPLTDIVGQLRAMADEIESGERSITAVLFIVPNDDTADFPAVFGWGEYLNNFEIIGVLYLAITFFATQQSERT